MQRNKNHLLAKKKKNFKFNNSKQRGRSRRKEGAGHKDEMGAASVAPSSSVC